MNGNNPFPFILRILHFKFFNYRWVAVGWLLIISVLFILPGSAIPKENWFSKIYLDKWVHISFFAVLVFLWRSSFQLPIHMDHFLVLFFAFLYGIMVEIIQHFYVFNRSFDIMDIAADFAGSILGLAIWAWGEKNKPL